MPKRARRFVAGYSGDGQIVYGKLAFLGESAKAGDLRDYCEPMTRAEARRALKQLQAARTTIYELVPVEGKP